MWAVPQVVVCIDDGQVGLKCSLGTERKPFWLWPERSGGRIGFFHKLMVITRSSVISRTTYAGPSLPKPLSFTPP